mmetsp:Transcript_2222/g.2589  ORF Transcript_2222/g.2589 Transcript_2222/m.2589 type:complete len:134 (+) Transcript_2222:26-427(+)
MVINLNLLSKILNVSLAIASIALGVLRLVFTGTFEATSLLSILLSAYLIIFGLFLLVASLYVKILIKWFGFFETYLGRGIFLFFMASLCFSGYDNFIMIIIGFVFVVSAVIHIIITFTVAESPHEKASEESML